MELLCKPMGSYQTNCYIVKTDTADIIIDPGVGAFEWIKANVTNPVAILNTHGHFDHVWSNAQVKEHFNIPIYCPKGDVFMLQNDPYKLGMPSSNADVEVDGDEEFELGGVKVKFWHFAGHTPGCSLIEIEGMMFSGDFIFANSIGRVDLPGSSPSDMKKSILKVLKFQNDCPVYPGHGEATTLSREQYTLPQWVMML